MANSERRAPGMADVARVAGVSHQTVSRVLNTPRSVRPETRERVLQAIKDLGYRRNMGARALATNHSGLIGVILAQGSFYGPGQASASIQVAARRRGYATLVAALEDHGAAEVSHVINQFLDYRVDGMITIATQPEVVALVASAAGSAPHVLVADTPTPPSGMHVVAIDQQQAAGAATQHLIDLGHRDIAHLRGPSPWFDADQRVKGWRAALDSADLVAPAPLQGDWTAESGHAAGIELCDTGLPSAIVAANDLMALGLLSAFRERGARVPQDISIVGHDDSYGTHYFQPPLTTIRQPFEELGEASVAALFDVFAGTDLQLVHVKPQLVVRQSTAEPTPRLLS